jgi:hypothetical protein
LDVEYKCECKFKWTRKINSVTPFFLGECFSCLGRNPTLASTWKHLKRIKENKWAWKKVALKMKVQHTLYKGTHK